MAIYSCGKGDWDFTGLTLDQIPRRNINDNDNIVVVNYFFIPDWSTRTQKETVMAVLIFESNYDSSQFMLIYIYTLIFCLLFFTN